MIITRRLVLAPVAHRRYLDPLAAPANILVDDILLRQIVDGVVDETLEAFGEGMLKHHRESLVDYLAN